MNLRRAAADAYAITLADALMPLRMPMIIDISAAAMLPLITS